MPRMGLMLGWVSMDSREAAKIRPVRQRCEQHEPCEQRPKALIKKISEYSAVFSFSYHDVSRQPAADGDEVRYRLCDETVCCAR